MTTLLQLRRMVRNRLGVNANDGFFSDPMVNDAINNAIVTLEAERNWPWQERIASLTVTSTDGTIDVPSDWRSTKSIAEVATDELTSITPYDLLRFTENTGTPEVFVTVNRTIHVRPIPSTGTVLKIVYYRQPSYLTEDSDETDMPDTLYPAIVAKAAQLCSIREDDRAAATAHLVEYQQWLDRLMTTTRASTRSVGRRIRPGNWV